jgi:hypothetical protein
MTAGRKQRQEASACAASVALAWGALERTLVSVSGLHPGQAFARNASEEWIRGFHCPQEQLPPDPDARKSWQWNKAKKWVMHITSRLFNRWACSCALRLRHRHSSPDGCCFGCRCNAMLVWCVVPALM